MRFLASLLEPSKERIIFKLCPLATLPRPLLAYWVLSVLFGHNSFYRSCGITGICFTKARLFGYF